MIIWITCIILLASFNCVNCSEKEFSTCFHHFGCFNFTNEWFNPELRPTNLEPLERHIVNTKFLLLTATPESNIICYDPITSNPTDINITLYENHFALMVLIHDFTSNGYTGWIKHTAIELSQLERYNVISVDWQEGAEPPFLQAISNARVVAREIQLLLTTLHEQFELIWSEIHLVGHGLGAHIAGYVGKALSGRIGRITGLDPTGPCFEGMPPEVRLNYDDAVYVEVIHTDGAGHHHQGTMQPLGNMDFYFNNGSAQPGCHNVGETMSLMDVKRDNLKEGSVLPDCSHKRAFHYYLDALREQSCSFLALPWGTPSNVALECVRPSSDQVMCATVGLDVDTKYYARQVNAKYEINTASCKPFCMNRYQIQIDFAKCVEADDELVGYFIVIAQDTGGLTANLTFNHDANDSQVILKGERLTFTAWDRGTPLDEVSKLNVTWHFTTPFCFFCLNATCVDRVSITHVRSHVTAVDAPTTSQFCPSTPHRYEVLYDHESDDRLVQCKRKRT